MASDPIDPDAAGRVSSYALEVTVQADSTGIVLLVDGEIDMASVPTLTTCLDHVLAGSFDSVIVDLSGVTFVDSSGIAALLDASRRLAESSRRFGVRNAQPAVRRVFTITGLDDLVIDASS